MHFENVGYVTGALVVAAALYVVFCYNRLGRYLRDVRGIRGRSRELRKP